MVIFVIFAFVLFMISAFLFVYFCDKKAKQKYECEKSEKIKKLERKLAEKCTDAYNKNGGIPIHIVSYKINVLSARVSEIEINAINLQNKKITAIEFNLERFDAFREFIDKYKFNESSNLNFATTGVIKHTCKNEKLLNGNPKAIFLEALKVKFEDGSIWEINK